MGANQKSIWTILATLSLTACIEYAEISSVEPDGPDTPDWIDPDNKDIDKDLGNAFTCIINGIPCGDTPGQKTAGNDDDDPDNPNDDGVDTFRAPMNNYKFKVMEGTLGANKRGVCASVTNGDLPSGNQQVFCWGDNSANQINFPPLVQYVQSAYGYSPGTTYYVHPDSTTGNIITWPEPIYNETIDIPYPVTGITGGYKHVCMIHQGKVICRGHNPHGMWGVGTANTGCPHENGWDCYVKKEDGSDLSGVKEIFSGHGHSCAITNNEDFYCWGRNNRKQICDYTDNAGCTQDRKFMTAYRLFSITSYVSDVQDAGLGDNHTCILRSRDNNSVWCYGYNDERQLGDNTLNTGEYAHDVLRKVDGLSEVRELEAGTDHTCAIDSLDNLYCWGKNSERQVNGGNGNTVDEPFNILSGVEDVALGIDHTCAILTNKEIHCWGSNTYGQLGQGGNAGKVGTYAVKGLPTNTDPVALTAGFQFTCALFKNGGVMCWGKNDLGQLGIANTDDQYLPVRAKIQGIEKVY